MAYEKFSKMKCTGKERIVENKKKSDNYDRILNFNSICQILTEPKGIAFETAEAKQKVIEKMDKMGQARIGLCGP